MDIRQRLFQLRSFSPVPLLVLGALLGRPTLRSILWGFGAVIAGELLRLWGVAHAGSETRTTDTVGGSRLVTSGPFAFVRNPLYVGNIVIYTGVGVMTNAWWVAVAGFLFFSAQYMLIVDLEEEHLANEFKEEYQRYVRAVPRFVPTFKRYATPTALQAPSDWIRGLRSEKSSLLGAGVVTLLFAALAYFNI